MVLLGRSSQFILSGHPEAIHFLLIADRAHRIRFIQDRYNLSPNRAEKEVVAAEKRREHLYAKSGCSTYDDPQNYHMVLNMNRLSLEEAAAQTVLPTRQKQHKPVIPAPKKTRAE